MRNKILCVAGAVLLTFLIAQQVSADGLVVRPIAYEGSLNARSQEAIIIVHKGDKPRENEGRTSYSRPTRSPARWP